MNAPKPVAMVTGGSRGIGAAIAQQLGKDGFHVIVTYSSGLAGAEATVSKIKSTGGSAEVLALTVQDSAGVTQAFEGLRARLGRLDVLVNNAGVTADGLILRLKDEDIARVLDTNLKGALYCSREAAKIMLKQRSGTIIQISSVVGQMGNAGQTAYCASKSGLEGLTRSLALELASRNIRVNAVAPGFIDTDMTQALTPPQKEAILRQIPLGSMGKPEDIANVVSFLASPQSAYITGQVLGVNGGMRV